MSPKVSRACSHKIGFHRVALGPFSQNFGWEFNFLEDRAARVAVVDVEEHGLGLASRRTGGDVSVERRVPRIAR